MVILTPLGLGVRIGGVRIDGFHGIVAMRVVEPKAQVEGHLAEVADLLALGGGVVGRLGGGARVSGRTQAVTQVCSKFVKENLKTFNFPAAHV